MVIFKENKRCVIDKTDSCIKMTKIAKTTDYNRKLRQERHLW